MRKEFISAATAVVILIIIIVVLVHRLYVMHDATYERLSDYMYGYWVGDANFCEDAEISSILLFIGENTLKSPVYKRNAYLIINNDITNQQICINYNKSDCAITDDKRCLVKVKIDFTDDTIIPSDVHIDYDIVDGLLRIHDGETVYGVFYKDHEVTDMLK